MVGGGSNININSGGTLILPTIAAGSSGVSYSTTTGLVTIQTTGLYHVGLLLCFTSAVVAYIQPNINGTDAAPQQGRPAQNNTALASMTGSNIYNLTSGQTFGLIYNGNAVTIAGNPQDTLWFIRKVA